MNFDDTRNTSSAGRPHHPLSLAGLAPWPLPEALSLADVQADPAARCCRECGRSLTLLLLESSTWVAHRSEHVTFHDDRSVARRVTVEFHVPERAPYFQDDDGVEFQLVPLSVLRRKTLVNYDLRDADGRPVFSLSLRQNQALTESMLLACADATPGLDCPDRQDAGRRAVARFIHQVVSGDQRDLTAAYRSLEKRIAAPAVLHLVSQNMFRALLDRLADNFVLWVMIPAGSPRRRVLTFSSDEPLHLRYRRPGFDEETGVYKRGRDLRPWHPTVWCSALGFTTTRIRFPVPAAENAASFHFEIDAPRGVQIAEASLLAGRPDLDWGPHDARRKDDDKLSFDRVRGGFPTVGLHVVEVPNGSLSRVQLGLQVVTRGWLMTSMLSAWAVFGLLLACWWHRMDLSEDKATPALILVAAAAGVAALIAQSVSHGLAAHLLKWSRALASAGAGLPVVAATFIAFESGDAGRVADALLATVVVAGAIAVTLSAVCLLAWGRQRRENVQSPWEHRYDRTQVPPREISFLTAARTYRYVRPAMRVDSAEGWHTNFSSDWPSDEARLIDALIQQSRNGSGRHCVTAMPGQVVAATPGRGLAHQPPADSWPATGPVCLGG